MSGHDYVTLKFMFFVSATMNFLLFYLWTEYQHKARDYGTELTSLIYNYDLDARDLRRSLRHKEIRKAIYRNKDLPEDMLEKMKDS